MQPVWDEDDVMLFLWGNSMAARERQAKEANNINKWRAGTSTDLELQS